MRYLVLVLQEIVVQPLHTAIQHYPCPRHVPLTCMKAVQRSQVTSLRDLVMLPASTQHGTAATVVVASALAREAAATSNTSSMVYNVMDHANNNGEKCCFVGNVLYH